MHLDLRTILRIVRRWWLVLLLGPLLAGGAAFWSASQQQEMYSARATLLITQPDPTEQNLSGLQAGERLGATYQQLVGTDPVLQAVIDRLGLPTTVGQLRSAVSASAVTGTQLLRVTVVDADPVRAATIADAVAEEFTVVVSDRAAQSTSGSREALDTQIAATEGQIADLNARITELETAQATTTTAEGQTQLATLRSSLSQQQIAYGNLLSQQQAMDLGAASIENRITLWERARVPEAPYAPRTTLYTALAVVVGLIIVAAGVLLVEYLDNTVKSGEDVAELLDLPVLAEVRAIPKLQPGRDQLFVLNSPASTAAESIRLLRTNLEFAAASGEISTMLVSSAGPSEGKSTTAANLAVATASAGLVTVLIDADLRRPTQHRVFDVPNARGLTSLLTHPQQSWSWAAAEVMPRQLFVIPSGPQPPNPTDLLSSDRLRLLLAELRGSVDLVIIDSPPVLAAPDALVMAPHTDGVVMLCRAGQTRQDALRRAVETLKQGTIRNLGIVVNGQRNRNESGYYYGDYYAAANQQAPVASATTPAHPVA